VTEADWQQGARVEKGMILGAIGSSGRSTGPHLHYEVIKYGNKQDPTEYINIQPFLAH
jgi:murein DD-endopeptidase MepM/ murein hydrolase activator NlpD